MAEASRAIARSYLASRAQDDQRVVRHDVDVRPFKKSG